MSEILPLALTMIVGPQIIVPIILITAKNVIKPSLAYIIGVFIAATIGTFVFALVGGIFNWEAPGAGEPSTAAVWIQTGLILLLIAMSIKTFVNRHKVELPKWITNLQNANAKSAFKTALLLIFFMPTDIIVMLTVGINLASGDTSQIKVLPFLLLTTLLAALPLLVYLFMGKRAVTVMPRVRRWMDGNSWVVSLTANLLFIYLLWA